MTTPMAAGYFTPGRVQRLVRQSTRHWGWAVIGGRPSIGCPCCGRHILARPTTGHRDVDDAICDALSEHLRADCPHAGYAPVLLDEPAPEHP